MNKKRNQPKDLEEYVSFKEEFEQQYKQKNV